MPTKTYFHNIILGTVLLCSVISFTSCQKYNQVDNSSTVKTPYILFVGGYNGTIHKTNEGLYYNTLFYTDNSCVRQIIVADSMLLQLKQNFYYSDDEGRSFKQSAGSTPRPYFDLFYKYYYPNQAIYDKGERKVYLCGNADLRVSTDLGRSFVAETNWAVGDPAISPSSITQLDNGTLFIFKDTANIYKKSGTGAWTKVISDTTRLPSDTGARWYLSSTHDTLIAIDFTGKAGVQYSIDGGRNWNGCGGMPRTNKILFGNEAFGNGTFYIGYDSAGLYKLKGNNFEQTSAGIPWFAKVGYVQGKQVTYRTNVVRTYIYCATDHGLFVSETNGLDWDLVRMGSFSTLH